MTDKTIPQSGHVVPAVFTRDMLDWLPWLEPMAAEQMTAAAARQPGRRRAREVAVLPPAGARSRRARGAHPHRQGHLLQSRRRPAARRARAGRRRDLAAERLHLLRLGACPLRRDLFQAGADVDKLLAEGTGADLDKRWNAIVAASVALTATPIAFGPQHIDALRDGRARRRRDRRRDQRRLVLQLGQPPDAVARRADAAPSALETLARDTRRCRACRGRCIRPDPRRNSLPSARS